MTKNLKWKNNAPNDLHSCYILYFWSNGRIFCCQSGYQSVLLKKRILNYNNINDFYIVYLTLFKVLIQSGCFLMYPNLSQWSKTKITQYFRLPYTRGSRSDILIKGTHVSNWQTTVFQIFSIFNFFLSVLSYHVSSTVY